MTSSCLEPAVLELGLQRAAMGKADLDTAMFSNRFEAWYLQSAAIGWIGGTNGTLANTGC